MTAILSGNETIANNPAEKHMYNTRHMMTEYMRLECSVIYRLNFRNHANIKRLLSTRAYYSERRSFFFEGKRQLQNCQNTAQRIRFNRAQCFVEHLLDYPHVSRKPLEMYEEYSANNIRTTIYGGALCRSAVRLNNGGFRVVYNAYK